MSWTTPQDVTAELERHWQRGRILSARLTGEPLFPLALRLKRPSPGDLGRRFSEARTWIQALHDGSRASRGCGYEIGWEEVAHRELGRNRLPSSLSVPTEADALALLGRPGAGAQFSALADQALAAFPQLGAWIARKPLAVIDNAADWERILAVLAWFKRNPRSGLYLRQIDVAGVDTKFVEARAGLLADLLEIVLETAATPPAPALSETFENRFGLRARPPLVRFRILDARHAIGGLTDITTPVEQMAALRLGVKQVFITENEVNGLAFPDALDSIVIFKLGYGIDLLSTVPWLSGCDVRYWGDIDTHGFAILDRLRAFCPQALSLLMDQETLLSHRHLWVREDVPLTARLTRLTAVEHALYQILATNSLGDRIRLEQERIPLSKLVATLKSQQTPPQMKIIS